MKEHKFVGLFALLIGALCIAGVAQSQSPPAPTLTANQTVADGSLVPVLTWTVPAGATSCVASGAWTGAKSVAGGSQTLSEIRASANYTLTCQWPDTPGSPGALVVSWTAPTTNTNGSALTNLAGYEVVVGRSADALTQTTRFANPGLLSATIPNLAAGTWYVGVLAFNSNDARSVVSNVVPKTVGTPAVPGATGAASVAITIRPVPSPPVVTTVNVVKNVHVAPVFRVSADGLSINTTLYGMVPKGRQCGAYVATYRGVRFYRVNVRASEVWGTTNTSNLAAPCA